MSRLHVLMRVVLPILGVSGMFLSRERACAERYGQLAPAEPPCDWLERLVRRLNTAILG